jgi:periplasmic protein TonB
MRSPLVVASLGIHVVIVLGLFVAGFWRLDRLEPGRRSVDLAVSSPPPPAPSGSPAAAPAQPFDKKRRKIAREVVQPVRVEPEVTAISTAMSVASGAGDGGGGTGEGAGGGSGSDPDGQGSCTGGPCGEGPAMPSPPPPPAVEPPRIVSPAVIKGLRVSGDTQIHPPAPVKTAILRDGRSSVTALFRVCIGTAGQITSAARQKSSGYPPYDQALESALWTWRYRPYEVGGRKVSVCGVVTFIYSIQ